MAREATHPTRKAKTKDKVVKAKPKTALKRTTAVANEETRKTTTKKKPNRRAIEAAKKSAVKKPAKKVTTRAATSKKTAAGPALPQRTTAKKGTKRSAPKMNPDQVIKEFRTVVNLTPAQLERWLSLPDSKKLRFKDEVKAATVGHDSGRRILKILGKRRDKYTDEDLLHMQTVVGFVRDHLSQKPPGDIVASNWRYSLMNWGHDPTKQRTR